MRVSAVPPALSGNRATSDSLPNGVWNVPVQIAGSRKELRVENQKNEFLFRGATISEGDFSNYDPTRLCPIFEHQLQENRESSLLFFRI